MENGQKRKRRKFDYLMKALVRRFADSFLYWLFPEMEGKYGKLKRSKSLSEETEKAAPDFGQLVMDAAVEYEFENKSVIMLLFEFQYNRSAFNIRRLHNYYASLLYRYQDVEILPVVIFLEQTKPKILPASELRIEHGGNLFLYFSFKSVHLMNLETENFIKGKNPLLKVLSLFMNHDKKKKAEYFIETMLALHLTGNIETAHSINRELEEHLSFYNDQYSVFQNILTKRGNMLLLQRTKDQGKIEGKIEGKKEGKKEGKIEGKIEGKKEGKIEGKRETLKSLLSLKFYDVPEKYKQTLKNLDMNALVSIERKILDANSLEELF